jgi:O-antigen/teichoic acid export membrane protein
MGLATMPQIAISLYFGGLMGLQRQVSANLLWICFGILRSGVVILPIYYVPDIRLFFIWQAIASFAMLYVMRVILIRQIVKPLRKITITKINGNFSWSSMSAVRGYAFGMFGMSIIAALNMQIDKIIVSKLLSISEFAEYYLASTIAQIPYIVTMPIAVALLPRITNLLTDHNQRDKVTILYRNATYYIASFGAVAGFGIFLFLRDIFHIWMPNQSIGINTFKAAELITLGSVFLSLQLAPFQLSLAYGHQATNLRLGVVILSLSIPFQIIMINNFGIVGASVPWLLINLVAFLYLGFVLNRKFRHVRVYKWFIEDNFVPILFALFWMYIARIISDMANMSPLINIFIAGIGVLVFVVNVYFWRRHFKF